MKQPSPTTRHELQRLRQAVERGVGPSAERVRIGLAALDGLLPGGGLKRGSLVEWLSVGEGSGASLLTLLTVRHLQQQGYTLIVVDSAGEFYPPGADELGIDLDRTMVVQPTGVKETLWTLEQALRCDGKVLAVGLLGKWPHSAYRRLKLAAERGGSIGFLLGPAEAARARSWADLRLLVTPLPSPEGFGSGSRSRRLKLSVLAARGSGWHERGAVMEISDESGALSVVSELERAAGPARIARVS